jgi:hypothetical protein
LDGFYDVVIDEMEDSFGTKVNYTHYTIDLPKDDFVWTRSGNYVLEVFSPNNPEEVLISRRFVVYEDLSLVQAEVREPVDIALRRTHQEISFVVKAITWVAQILPSFSGLLFHPATLSILGIKGTLDESEQGGLAQWWTVGCLIFFYLTYSLDLLCMGHHLGQNNDAPSTKSKQN